MTGGRLRTRIRRRCHDCGATDQETAFPGTRKPYKRRDQCTDCAADPLPGIEARVSARRAEIAALMTAGRFRLARPVHTLPLFRGLRPGGETDQTTGGN